MTRVRWIVCGVVLTTAFLALGLLVARQPLALDTEVAVALQGKDTQPAGRVAGVLTNFLGPVLPYVLGAALLIFVLFRRQHLVLCLKLAVVLVLCRLTSLVFKPVFERQRPRAYPELSYPSGHVVAVASTGLVAVLLLVWLAPRLVKRVVAIAVVATLLAAACRIVLGVHWVSDTVGSVLAVGGVGLLSAAGLGLLPARGERSLDR
ncbi:MAG TPA: phosphatase PAP2 family protein [Amycolatopsis sp.]|nr:phosphatase PAP2 family protein [Amycolatopsis sp.]